jgi:hypothetical protein
MLRIVSERTMDIVEKFSACVTDWQKAFYSVKKFKLMQILKGGGIDWRESRLIIKLCMDQSVTVGLDEQEARSVKI